MNAAAWPRADRASARLLLLDRSSGKLSNRCASDLPGILRRGDLLVVNDAATLPASLQGEAEGLGPIELRLASEDAGTWRAVLFSAGNWRVPTERRPAPAALGVGTRLKFDGLTATVTTVLPQSPRLLSVRFDQTGAAFWAALYRAGRPVQYAYLSGPLRLWHVQNGYAARPWAMEAPSAGFVLTGRLIAALRSVGVQLAALTHAAGLSATGDAALDRALPLDERFEIPAACVEAIARAKAGGARVIAVGTSVVRALEGRALERGGQLLAGAGQTALRLGPGFVPQVVDGLLSGIHDPAASHHALLQAFVPRDWLDRAHHEAEACGYLEHEFGDVCLIA